MKQLLLIEPLSGGHHLLYVRRLVAEWVRRGYAVRLATFPSSLGHPMYQSLVEAGGEALSTTCITNEAFWRRALGSLPYTIGKGVYYRMFQSLYRRLAPPDVILLPYIDYIDYPAALLGSPFGQVPWAGLTIHTSFHYKHVNIQAPRRLRHLIERPALERLLAQPPFKGLFTIDPLLPPFLQKTIPAGAAKLHYVPDPIEPATGTLSQAEARYRLNLPQQGLVLLVYGAITARKGIRQLLQAAQRLDFPPGLRIVVAGSQSGVEPLFRSTGVEQLRKSGRLIELNRFLTDHEERLAFAAADMAWLGYEQFESMSGVLLLAARSGLPVVACREGLIGWVTASRQLGPTLEVQDPQDICRTLAALLNDPSRRATYADQGRRFAATHTDGTFSRAICDVLEEAALRSSAGSAASSQPVLTPTP